jgi:hypothetical protein
MPEGARGESQREGLKDVVHVLVEFEGTQEVRGLDYLRMLVSCITLT